MSSNTIFIVLLSIICVNISHQQECCSFSECSIEKVDIVNRLMALALEIQTSISQSNARCRADYSNNTTTIYSSTTTPTTIPISTSTFMTETTTEAQSTTSPPPIGKYFIPVTYGLYTREVAISTCANFGMHLVAIDEPNEWVKLKEFMETVPYEPFSNQALWTAGEKTCSVSSYSDYSCFKWTIGGTQYPIDFTAFTQQVNVVDNDVMLLQASRTENPPSSNYFVISSNNGPALMANAICERPTA